MLYAVPQLDQEEEKVIRRIEAARQLLRHNLSNPRRWTGLIARITRARAIRASNSIEGIHVSLEDAIAAVDGEEPTKADRETWLAVVGYRHAMDFILQRCRDPQFRFSLDLVLALHFMITQHDLKANPGNLRPGWIGVRNTETGELVHEGADRDFIERLLEEYITFLNSDPKTHVMVKAAMAHLNLVMIHPFSDGNGRVARCIQTAILANEGIVSPEFSSIEEYTGKNVNVYYNVLAETGGGGWNPKRDARPWMRFCLTAHYRQAQTLLRRLRETERIADELSQLIKQRELSERLVFALIEAAFGYRVRNSSYRVSADISRNLASRDLKLLVDAGLLIREGERRGSEYKASLEIQELREKHRFPKTIPDPFQMRDELDAGQPTLI